MKKRWLAWALAVLMCSCMMACDKKKDEDESSGKNTTTSRTTNPTTTAPSSTSSTSKFQVSPTTGETTGQPAQGHQTGVLKPEKFDATMLSSLSTKKIGWGPGRSQNHIPPSSCVTSQSTSGKYGALFIGPTDQKNIYLTFDEGYEYGLSGNILDTLKAKKVSATFFVTMDFVKAHPELVKRMIAEGHTVGNHSTTHPSFPTISPEKMTTEVLTLHNYVKENFGYTMTYFRFPMGEYSEQSLAALQMCGYKSVFWSFAYRDWLTDSQPDPGTSLTLITGQTHPGAIYLLHAVSKTNATILGDFIDQARNQGYTFVKMNL